MKWTKAVKAYIDRSDEMVHFAIPTITSGVEPGKYSLCYNENSEVTCSENGEYKFCGDHPWVVDGDIVIPDDEIGESFGTLEFRRFVELLMCESPRDYYRLDTSKDQLEFCYPFDPSVKGYKNDYDQLIVTDSHGVNLEAEVQLFLQTIADAYYTNHPYRRDLSSRLKYYGYTRIEGYIGEPEASDYDTKSYKDDRTLVGGEAFRLDDEQIDRLLTEQMGEKWTGDFTWSTTGNIRPDPRFYE